MFSSMMMSKRHIKGLKEKKMYLLIQTVAFEVDLFCFSFISCSSAISNMAKVSNNVGVFTGNPSFFVYICVHIYTYISLRLLRGVGFGEQQFSFVSF